MGDTVIDTIGALRRIGWSVTGRCLDCRHSAAVDLAAVAARYGDDWMFVGRQWPVKCSRCGGRRVDIRLGGKNLPRW